MQYCQQMKNENIRECNECETHMYMQTRQLDPQGPQKTLVHCVSVVFWYDDELLIYLECDFSFLMWHHGAFH